MAKQYLNFNEELLEEGKWAEFVKSLEYGIYDVPMKGYAELQRLRNTISRANNDTKCRFKFKTNVKYDPLVLHIETDLK